MKQLKLEVGKTYRNRKGEEVGIVKNVSGADFPYKGTNNVWYTESGKWGYGPHDAPRDLIEEVEELPETRHTFDIPGGVKKVTVEQVGNRIVVEMVPEKEPKPGDVMVNKHGKVYILKAVEDHNVHRAYVWLDKSGRMAIRGACYHGRPATPEEAQPLWDALKKAGKRWNAETMQVEDVPESDRILEWVEEHLNDGHYNQQGIAEVIGHYLKHKEGEK